VDTDTGTGTGADADADRGRMRPMVPRALRRLWLRATLGGGSVAFGPARPQVALTFDDGPDARWTPAILDILAERGVRATFFVLGMHVERAPELARAVAAGHEIGCHSHAHERDGVASMSAFRADVARFRAVVGREVGVDPRFYRFPWGDRGRIEPWDVLALERMTCVHWSASGGDDALDADAIVARVRRRLEPGAILLLHDGVAPGSVRRGSRDETVRALPGVLDAIAASGLRPVTVGELLAAR
jgi:peptidoglycan-N-acetylglucosamine deacetylase